MDVFLKVVQILLALHTAMGAAWKFTTPVTAVPSLSALTQGGWLGLGVIELFLAVGLVLPARSRALARAAPLAAAGVGAEMLLFTAVSLASGAGQPGEIGYWLVVAAICGFVVWGRAVRTPAAVPSA
ncbi:MAG: hypothetical protein QM704_07170 [Anaeromyxobacteraceae bacterium]